MPRKNHSLAHTPSRFSVLAAGLILSLFALTTLAQTGCGPTGVHLQVLGSGGPTPDVGRASSGYLVWVDGKARLMVDAGSGTFTRFAEAGARIEDLDLIAITHLHTDHAGALAGLVKGGYFSDRERPLKISGPDEAGRGGRAFPALNDHVDALFNARTGAFRYLSDFLDGGDAPFKLDVLTLPAKPGRTSTALEEISDGHRIRVTALGVEHGIVPALAYRVDIDGTGVVFSGDQNGNNPAFPQFARGARLLVMTHAVPEDAGPVARRLHALPSEIGRNAAQAGVGELLLSHLMRRSLDSLDANLAEMRKHYRGPIKVAADLMCVPLEPKPN